MVILKRYGCFWSCELKHNLGKKTPPHFPYANWSYARLFVYRDQAAKNKYTGFKASTSRYIRITLLMPKMKNICFKNAIECFIVPMYPYWSKKLLIN